MAHLHSVYDTDLHFEIDPITRAISSQASAKTKLIQNDHNSERFTFEISRFVESHDMSLCDKIEIHHINISANKTEQSEDVYLVDDAQLSPEDDNVFIFSWLISGNATKYAGTLNFLIRFVCLTGETIDYAWHTEIYDKITVSNGMNNGEAVIEEYSDVLEAWKREVCGAAEEAVTRAEAAADRAENSTPYIGENGNWWVLGVDTGVSVTPKFDPTKYALPALYFEGDISAMTKENAVTLNYVYGERSGTCTLKWQGNSSLEFPKKNYTVKFDNAFEAKEGWGEQKKYCLKADWVDFSHCRNVVSAKVWGDVVRSRATSELVTRLSALPNCGAIDGFPCFVIINGEWMGVYNFNIPKDGWMFGMGSGEKEAILCANKPDGYGCRWKLPASVGDETKDYEIEYVTDEDNAEWVQTSIDALINACINCTDTTFDTTVAQYIDIDSAIDYFIFCVLSHNSDGIGKNHLLVTYDGTKWFFSAYDMDGTWGLEALAQFLFSADLLGNELGSEIKAFEHTATRHMIFRLIYSYALDRLIARYNELRAKALSVSSVMERFYNYAKDIPTNAKMADAEKWTAIPFTDVNNVSQITAWYSERSKSADTDLHSEKPNLLTTAKAYFTDEIYNGVGYKDGYTMTSSNTDFSESVAEGYVLTGRIPYNSRDALDNPIYIKGNIEFDDSGNCAIGAFNDNNAFKWNERTLAKMKQKWNITKLGEGYYRLVAIRETNIDVPKWFNWAGASSYIFFALKGTGEGLKISVGRPIETETENDENSGDDNGGISLPITQTLTRGGLVQCSGMGATTVEVNGTCDGYRSGGEISFVFVDANNTFIFVEQIASGDDSKTFDVDKTYTIPEGAEYCGTYTESGFTPSVNDTMLEDYNTGYFCNLTLTFS